MSTSAERDIFGYTDNKPRRSVRSFLREPGNLVVGVVVVAAASLYTAQNVKEHGVIGGPTAEQKKGLELFLSPDNNENFVYNLVVGSEGVNVRTRQHTETGSIDDTSIGVKVRKLDPGTVIEKALVVWGNNPKNPSDRKAKDYWYLFPDPKNPKTMIFANSGLFEYNPETYSVQPLDVEN